MGLWESRLKSNSELFTVYGFSIRGNQYDFLDLIPPPAQVVDEGFLNPSHEAIANELVESVITIIAHWQALVSSSSYFRALPEMLGAGTSHVLMLAEIPHVFEPWLPRVDNMFPCFLISKTSTVVGLVHNRWNFQ